MLMPALYKGTATEDVETWLRHFLNYCAYKDYTEAKKLNLFKLLLTGSAAIWLETLPSDITDSWGNLQTAFLTRYSTPELMRFKSARDWLNRKQGPSESADDFVASMQRLAKSIGADDQMTRFAILNGLRPEIATYVIQRQPTNVKELLDAARIGEMCVIKPETDSTVTTQIAQVQDQLRQLTAKLETSRASTVMSVEQRLRAPSSKRVHLVDGRTARYDTRDCSPRRYVHDYRHDYRHDQDYDNNRQPNVFVRSSSHEAQPREQCSKCGLRVHHSLHDCPAINKECFKCARMGHLARVCTSDRQTE